MQVRWFFDYVDARGNNLIAGWLLGLPPKARARMERLILRLEAERLPPAHVMEHLRGARFNVLLALRMDSMNVEYRLIGSKGPGNHQVMLLYGAEERGDVYVPRTALDTALVRRTEAMADPAGRLCAH